jgi:benzoate/toluate 1,2-dioxygenase alpha subunit
LYERRDELAQDFGKARADWMIENSRNLCLYPNVYLMDQFSSQIRIARPISVNRTEITIYCIAPKGESDRAFEPHSPVRRLLQRQRHGHAGRPGGVPLLPDQLPGQRHHWNDMSRGAEHWIEGADEAAKEIDLHPLLSGVRTEDEGLFVLQHKYWQQTMLKALAAEQSELIAVETVQ